MNKPNFFIIGAAKCGTTALSEYLKEHPDIHMSWPKEPHYFAYDLENYRYPKEEQAYLELFKSPQPGTSIFGEASVFYLYSDVALEEVKRFSPDAKIVALFRNPADMLYSLHSQLLYSRDEDVDDFAEAWKLCPDRKNGKHIPKNCREKKILYYNDIGMFGSQLERVKSLFDEEQVKVFFFEDFVKNPRQVYVEILHFLGLEDDQRSKFQKVNEKRGHKIRWLSNITQRPPKFLSQPVYFFKSLLGIKRFGILDYLRKKNLTTEPRKKMPQELRIQLLEYFRDDISKLSRLTGRNLDHWFENAA